LFQIRYWLRLALSITSKTSWPSKANTRSTDGTETGAVLPAI
jgi:hypothetical protein